MKQDLKGFCNTMRVYMNCIKGNLADCIGGKAGTGGLDELLDLNNKCCLYPELKQCYITSN